MGRAGRFGTKGLAITFVSSTADSEVLNQVRSIFMVIQECILCIAIEKGKKNESNIIFIVH